MEEDPNLLQLKPLSWVSGKAARDEEVGGGGNDSGSCGLASEGRRWGDESGESWVVLAVMREGGRDGDVRIKGIIRCSCTHGNDLIVPKFNDTDSRCTMLFDSQRACKLSPNMSTIQPKLLRTAEHSGAKFL